MPIDSITPMMCQCIQTDHSWIVHVMRSKSRWLWCGTCRNKIRIATDADRERFNFTGDTGLLILVPKNR